MGQGHHRHAALIVGGTQVRVRASVAPEEGDQEGVLRVEKAGRGWLVAVIAPHTPPHLPISEGGRLWDAVTGGSSSASHLLLGWPLSVPLPPAGDMVTFPGDNAHVALS